MALAENFRHLKFVVQDREAVTEMGVKVSTNQFPHVRPLVECLIFFQRCGKSASPNYLLLGRRPSKVNQLVNFCISVYPT